MIFARSRATLREAWARRKGVAAMKFAAAIGDELEKLTPLGGGARPLDALSAPAPMALLDPAAGDGPSRWGAQAPSYVTAEPRAAAPALVPPPADPLLRMVFARAYAEYLAWLKANPVA